MKYNPDIHHRRSIRLQKYNYTHSGAYFVTICAQDRKCIFGEIENGNLKTNQQGDIVYQLWHQIPEHFQNVDIDATIVMPNHFHGIVVILDNFDINREINEEGEETSLLLGKKPMLGQIVAYFKY